MYLDDLDIVSLLTADGKGTCITAEVTFVCLLSQVSIHASFINWREEARVFSVSGYLTLVHIVSECNTQGLLKCISKRDTLVGESPWVYPVIPSAGSNVPGEVTKKVTCPRCPELLLCDPN